MVLQFTFQPNHFTVAQGSRDINWVYTCSQVYDVLIFLWKAEGKGEKGRRDEKSDLGTGTYLLLGSL